MGRGNRLIKPSGIINPTISENNSRVGLIHTFLLMQVTWRDGECWIGLSDRSTRVDRMDAWTTGDDQATCVNWSVITAEVNRR